MPNKVSAKIVKVTVTGATEVELKDLVVIQGNLKDLTKKGFEDCRDSIITEGICEPFTIWIRQKDKAKCIVSGTQRYRVLTQMQMDGWQIPLLPASIVEAKTEAQALRKALVLAGSYGTITYDGIYEIVHRMGGESRDRAAELLKGFHSQQKLDTNYFLTSFFSSSNVTEKTEAIHREVMKVAEEVTKPPIIAPRGAGMPAVSSQLDKKPFKIVVDPKRPYYRHQCPNCLHEFEEAEEPWNRPSTKTRKKCR